MKVIAAYNIKGGVGKTSAAVNLAWHAAEDGRRTLLWDLDPQGAATYLLRVRPKVKGGVDALVEGRRDLIDAVKSTDHQRLDVLPADFSYRKMDLALDDRKRPERRLERLLDPLKRSYDVVVLDCPPSVSLVSESVLGAADLLVVPLQPGPLSLRTLDQLTDFVADAAGKPPRVLGFFSMVDRRRTLHREAVNTLPDERADVARVVVPYSSLVERMAVRRSPLGATDPNSEAARAYAELWRLVAAMLR